jgi:hypothetical protein
MWEFALQEEKGRLSERWIVEILSSETFEEFESSEKISNRYQWPPVCLIWSVTVVFSFLKLYLYLCVVTSSS